MTNRFVEITLGDEALAYVRENLLGGKRLSHALFTTLDLEAGTVTTFAPPNTSAMNLLQFSQGGLTQERSSQAERLGKVETTEAEAVSIIAAHLPLTDAAFCVFEAPMARRGDKFLSQSPVPLLFDADDVYLLIRAPTNLPTITRALNLAFSFRPPWLAALGAGPIDASANSFHTVAHYTTQLLMGAYDGESFMRWRRWSAAAPSTLQR
jgi:hypothetical protein